MPRHPNASTDEILSLTIDLVAKFDVSGVTVDMIAKKAGVSKATLYRRWASRNALILDAITRIHRPGSAPDTGSLKEDLIHLLTELVDFLNRRTGGKVFAAILNESIRNPKFAAAHRGITQEVRLSYETVIRRGMERGELHSGVDVALAIDALIAPFIVRRHVELERVEAREIEPLIDIVLKGLS